jgi:hypothetical protein
VPSPCRRPAVASGAEAAATGAVDSNVDDGFMIVQGRQPVQAKPLSIAVRTVFSGNGPALPLANPPARFLVMIRTLETLD